MAASKKKISGYIKLQLPAGKANQKLGDTVVPVVITVYADRSYSFVMKSAPASILLKQAAGLATSGKPGSGSPEPNRKKVGKVSKAQLLEIANTKLADMNTNDAEAAARSIAGTARSMGLEVTD